MIRRPNKRQYFMMMAQLVSVRGTCRRRKVGCVLVNERGHVLATGYNGAAAGQPHCLDKPCPGANADPGKGLDRCEAVHAEQNALLQCRDVYEIDRCFITASPCVTCVKLLLNTGCRAIHFYKEYPHKKARELWLDQVNGNGAKRAWVHEQRYKWSEQLFNML